MCRSVCVDGCCGLHEDSPRAGKGSGCVDRRQLRLRSRQKVEVGWARRGLCCRKRSARRQRVVPRIALVEMWEPLVAPARASGRHVKLEAVVEARAQGTIFETLSLVDQGSTGCLFRPTSLLASERME